MPCMTLVIFMLAINFIATYKYRLYHEVEVSIVSRASPFTREEGSGQLRITSLCCRVSSGQAVQGVSSNSMLFAVSRDAVLAGLFCARHTEYACARLVYIVCVHSTSYYMSCASFVVNTPRKSWQTLTKP